MRIKVTSFRGHHEAVADHEVGRAIFRKMTGQDEDPLGDDVKVRIPETFLELDALWRSGRMAYSAFRKDGDEIVPVREFDEQADDLLLIAPIQGG